MWRGPFKHSLARPLDRCVLYTMNRRLPDSFEASYRQTPALETVLAQTGVNRRKTAEYVLSAPGEHTVWLETAVGELACHVRVKPALDPQAPLLLYHHGFNETPYYNSWQRIFREPTPFPAHVVCVQAPFHDHWATPFTKGFASVHSLYQIFAGSLRLMELVQRHFTAQGSPYTVLAGVSWGGITTMLYEGIFQSSRAVVPMLSSPNLAQVMWDIAGLFHRELTITREMLQELLDFTPYYARCDGARVFPLMAERDLFFRLEKHSAVFDNCPVTTIPAGHVTGMWQAARLRRHVLAALAWAGAQ
jgi:hypothetical protein